MKTPKISVCLPTFNGAKYLAEAIESVLNQSVADIELVIGDDGSSDDTRALLENYARQDSRVSCFFNPVNIGYLRNTNEILKRCTGTYIKTFAQDDAFEPGCFERMLNILEEYPNVQLVACSRNHIDEAGKLISVHHNFDKTGVFIGADLIKLYLKEFRNRTGNPSQIFFRRQDRVNSFNTAFYHSADVEFGLRMLEGGDYYYISEPLLRYRVHKETTTITTLEDMSFAPDHVRMVDRFATYLMAEGVEKNEIWDAAIRGLINKVCNATEIRGITYNDFPTPKNWGQQNPFDNFVNDEPEVFRRLACHLLQYATERKLAFEDVQDRLGDVTREKAAVLAHNGQLLARISELETQLQTRHQEIAYKEIIQKSLTDEIGAMKSSRSWRLTAPLRKVSRKLAPESRV